MAQDGEDDVIRSFSCRIENVKSITDILNCLCIDMTKAQHCDVEATPDSKFRYLCYIFHFLILSFYFIALFFIVTGKAKATQVRYTKIY